MSNIVKGSGLIYTTGVPNTIPAQGYDSEFAIDINGNQYAWNRTTSVWDNLGQSIEIATSSVAPTHTPSNFRPRFVVTPNRTLYFHSGSSWGIVGALPSGVISSSTQIGPTGIYSGSGTVPSGTAAQLYNNSPEMQQHFLFNSTSIVGAGQLFGMQQIMPIAKYNSIVGFYQNDPAFFIHIENTDSQYKTINTFNNNKVEFSAESPDYTTKVIKIESDGITIADNKHSIILSDANLAIDIGSKSGVTGSFLISDSRDIPYGVIYNDDYSATFIDRSLVDKGYVTSASIGGIYNGSGTVPSGTAATIQIPDQYWSSEVDHYQMLFAKPSYYEGQWGDSFKTIGLEYYNTSNDLTTFAGFDENFPSKYFIKTYTDSNFYKNLGVSPDGIILTHVSGGNQETIYSEDGSPFRIISDSGRGLEYLANYSASFTPQSLVSKGYVDHRLQVTASTQATSASLIEGRGGIYNGSGVIPQLTTASVYSLSPGATGSLLFFRRTVYDDLYGQNIRRFGIFMNVTGSAFGFAGFLHNSGSIYEISSAITESLYEGWSKIKVDHSDIKVETTAGKGIEYLADYSETYTSRSLVDKGYVDNAIYKGFTQLDSEGEKGSLTISGSFTPSQTRLWFNIGSTVNTIHISIDPEVFSPSPGQEIEFIAYNTPTPELTFGFPYQQSTTMDLSTITDTKIVKFAWDSVTESWIIVNYVDLS